MTQPAQSSEAELKQLLKTNEEVSTAQTLKMQKDLLAQILEIRNAFATDLSSLPAIQTKTAEEGNDSSLETENKQLKEENARLNYRVDILTRNIREFLENKDLDNSKKEGEKLKYNIEHLRNVVRENMQTSSQ